MWELNGVAVVACLKILINSNAKLLHKWDGFDKQTGLHHFVWANKPVYTILFGQTNRFTPFCLGKQTGLHHFV